MAGIARAGDSVKVSGDYTDTTGTAVPPGPDMIDEYCVPCYSTEPKIIVQKVEYSGGSVSVFCNGRPALFVGSNFSNVIVTKYTRTYELDSHRQLTGVYSDEELSKEEFDGYQAVNGSSSVFIEGSPICREGDTTSENTTIQSGSSDCFAN